MSRPRPAEGTQQVEDAFQSLCLGFTADERGRSDGTGIDHRIEWPVRSLVKQDGIERVAGGLDADPCQNGIAAAIAQREPIDKRLDIDWIVKRLPVSPTW
jgi:hypothetical protein